MSRANRPIQMTAVINLERVSHWLGRLGPGGLAVWVTAALLIALAFSLARLTWAVLYSETVVAEAPALDPVIPGAGLNGVSPSPPALDSVARLHLFGQASPADRPTMVDIDAPETRLRLQLRGVVAAVPSGQGVALIASESGEERHYLPGAEIPGGATLEQVHPDRVVLSRAGRYELLRLPRDAPLSGDAPQGPAAQPGTGTGGASLPAETRRQWLEDPTALFDAVQVQPVMEGGSIHGFAISPRRDARMFREIGLRPGDVVTSVNGIAVAGMSDPTAIRDQLAGASEIRLDIERNGRPDTVVIPIGQ
jgi:general secretion pathway protein C